jgi:hypothetical protein
MKPTSQNTSASKTTRSLEPAEDAQVPGLRPPRRGCQPVKDFAAFLRSLPDFGPDAESLREAIEEERRLRRSMAEEADC